VAKRRAGTPSAEAAERARQTNKPGWVAKRRAGTPSAEAAERAREGGEP
jgi:bifunctional UDP-N-acetylglucosamine pyrophosphorylase/glucosamine-1-phosphate N-acetyltransferase